MSDAGRLTDTYAAALQHGLYEPDDETLVGVVRRPTRWFAAAVEENVPALAPSDDLLDEVQDQEHDFATRGLCEEEAHNAAFDAVDFEERYRTQLSGDDAETALSALEDRLRSGESIALVCYENTAKKRCHRTILREELDARLG